MVTIFKYFRNVLHSKKTQMSFEEKYLSKSVDLYDLERRQKDLDNSKTVSYIK
jgi:hypothetical protein